jgi:pyruvate-formate lyase-activating enzyme
MSSAGLFRRILRDRPFWGDGGGVTLTGGEPFTQPRFVQDVLKRCYDAYIHTAVETCGNVPWENIALSLPWIDWIFFDLKQMDGQKHRDATGHGNRTILENARRLSLEFKGRLVFRSPLVPGFNDSDDHLREMAVFISKIGQNTINLLPLHHLGREKYNLTGKTYYTRDFASAQLTSPEHIQSIFGHCNIRCNIGSDTPF